MNFAPLKNYHSIFASPYKSNKNGILMLNLLVNEYLTLRSRCVIKYTIKYA